LCDADTGKPEPTGMNGNAGSAPGTMATPLSRDNLAAATTLQMNMIVTINNRLRNRKQNIFQSSLSKLFQVKGGKVDGKELKKLRTTVIL